MKKAMWNVRLNTAVKKLDRARRYLAAADTDYRRLRVSQLSAEVGVLFKIVAVINTAAMEVRALAGGNASLDVLWWKRHHKALAGRKESAEKHLVKYPHLASKTTLKVATLESSEMIASKVLSVLTNAEKQIKELRSFK